MIWHVRKEHKLNFKSYILQTYYNNETPKCLKTGKELTFKPHQLGPWFSNYSKNNFPRKNHSEESKGKIRIGCERTSMNKFGVKNVFQTEWCKEKIKNTIKEKYGVNNPMQIDEFKQKMINSFFETIKNRPIKTYIKTNIDPNRPSKLEFDFSNKLKCNNIDFISPFVYNGKRFDFYIPILNTIIELDGEAYHKDQLESLTLKTINGSRNDYNKNNIIDKSFYDFYRIRYHIDRFIFNDVASLNKAINENKYFPNYGIKYKQKIVERKYFKRYISSKGKENLLKYSYLFLKFIRAFQPELPYPDLEEELGNIVQKVANYDIARVYDKGTGNFSSNISMVGNNYLKHYFHSYWGAKFSGNLSPKEAWLDNKIMKEVIEYRVGCNNSNEVYDFSLHQVVRGLSARRITVSFFPSLLAASIYSVILGDKEYPVVLDPCCGFGGRLLGFKSKYPNGTYIGCEPNIETYNELQDLVKRANWKNVTIYNCKFEEFEDGIDNYDLIFTSIPYYDIEIYSNNTGYGSFDGWRDTFIKSIEKYRGKNCYINVATEVANRLQWNDRPYKILKNTSHFCKSRNQRMEPIVRL
jgi:hypothetical protein